MNTQYIILNVANGNQIVDLSLIEGCPFPRAPWSNLETAAKALKWARESMLPEDMQGAYQLFVCQPLNM